MSEIKQFQSDNLKTSDQKNEDDGLYHHFMKSMKKEEEKLKAHLLLRGSKAIETLTKSHIQHDLLMSKLYILFIISPKDAYGQYRAYRIHLFIELLRDWTSVKLIKMSQEWKEMLDNDNPNCIFFFFKTHVSENLQPTIELMSISEISWYSFKKAYSNLQKTFQSWITEKGIVLTVKTSKLDYTTPVTILKKKGVKEEEKEPNYMKIDVQKANWTSICFIYQVAKKEQLPTWEKMIDCLNFVILIA